MQGHALSSCSRKDELSSYTRKAPQNGAGSSHLLCSYQQQMITEYPESSCLCSWLLERTEGKKKVIKKNNP